MHGQETLTPARICPSERRVEPAGFFSSSRREVSKTVEKITPAVAYLSNDLSPWWSWCSFIKVCLLKNEDDVISAPPNDCVWMECNRRPVASWWVLLFSPNWLGGGLKHLSKWSTLSEYCADGWVEPTAFVDIFMSKIRNPGNHRFSLGNFQADPVGPGDVVRKHVVSRHINTRYF